MKPSDNIKKLIKNTKINTNPEVNKAVLNGLLNRLDKAESVYANTHQPNIWRAIMKTPITKFAAAAVILIAVGLSITVMEKTTTPAYAFEQTIQASHSVRYIHTKSFWLDHEEPTEGWVEFDASGKVRNARMHMPAWTDPYGHDGEKKIVWKESKAHLWLKKKNFYGIIKDNEIANMIFESVKNLDPKTSLENFLQLESDGKISLDIDQPEDKINPIIVTVTIFQENSNDSPKTETDLQMQKMVNMFKGSPNDFSKIVLLIDQSTRLVKSIEFYEQRQDKELCVLILEYHDYNQPIAAKMFSLEDELPEDVLRVDQTAISVGLSQGQLSDNEVAVELIRQFLEALIDKDYAKAGMLFSGVPAKRMKKTYGKIRFIRIISIGEPVPNSPNGGTYVPCSVEIEEDGKIKQWSPKHSYVRQVHGQPQRWEIIGGFRGI